MRAALVLAGLVLIAGCAGTPSRAPAIVPRIPTPEAFAIETEGLEGPGLYRVEAARAGEDCEVLHPVANRWLGIVLWGYRDGLAGGQADLPGHWATHGFAVVASRSGDLTSLVACFERFRAEPPFERIMRSYTQTYASDHLPEGKLDDMQPVVRLSMTGSQSLRSEYGSLMLASTGLHQADRLLLWDEPNPRPGVESLRRSVEDSGVTALWVTRRDAVLNDVDLRKISTAWLYSTSNGAMAADWFKRGACSLCDDPQWRTEKVGNWEATPPFNPPANFERR